MTLPKIRGTSLGVSKIRIAELWGSFWGPPTLGKYQMLNDLLTFNDMIPQVARFGVFRVMQEV